MDTKLFAKSCAKTDSPQYDKLQSRAYDYAHMLHYSLGICTEAAEVADIMKKFISYGKQIDKKHLIEECGDILYYLARILDSVDSDLETAMERNVAKLKVRYPQGFSEEAAINRNLEAEKKELAK